MPTLREIDVKYRFKEVVCNIKGKNINSPERIAQLFDYLKYETKEQFIVVNLTQQHDINCFEVVATGTVNAIQVRPAEILRTAVLLNLPNILLIHNHPSGDPKPSHSDINFTERMIKAAEVLDIKVMDHLIIGLDCFTSLQQTHPQIF